jgi:HD-GYP domain-containing protein (c-di-GMP phosphodiesterase class II)
MRMITPGVCSIVYQHHEYNDGSGFPSGLTGNKIFPLAKIVALADGLTDFLKENNLSALEGLKEFLSDRQTLMRYEPELVRNLIKGFKG